MGRICSCFSFLRTCTSLKNCWRLCSERRIVCRSLSVTVEFFRRTSSARYTLLVGLLLMLSIIRYSLMYSPVEIFSLNTALASSYKKLDISIDRVKYSEVDIHMSKE